MAAIEHQQRRVERLLQMPPPAVAQDPVAAQLVAAADAFVVVPGSRSTKRARPARAATRSAPSSPGTTGSITDCP